MSGATVGEGERALARARSADGLVASTILTAVCFALRGLIAVAT